MNTVAKVIYQQIVAGRTYDNKAGTLAILCWGTNSLVAVEKGLVFKVKGAKHRGYVKVLLNGNDYYDVELFTARRQAASLVHKTKATAKDVCFENLTAVLDSLIESGL